MNTTHPGQLVTMGLPGPELSEGIADLIRQIQPGGFIFFTRNLSSPSQTHRLIRELHDILDVPPVITLGQEGGRVSRLKVIGEEPPSPWELFKAGKADDFHLLGELIGELMAFLGFNFNLAPVVDYALPDQPDNSLRGRCFGTSPQEALAGAKLFLEGMARHRIAGCIKHFPGYTHCELDPHGDLPKISRSHDTMLAEELSVFRELMPLSPAIMVGHGHFTAYHQEPLPASLSPVIVGDLLRRQLGYGGMALTDDLEMGAITNRYNIRETTRRALAAGQDMLLICHNPACAQLAYEELCRSDPNLLSAPLERVARFKSNLLRQNPSFDEEHFIAINREIKSFRERIRKPS